MSGPKLFKVFKFPWRSLLQRLRCNSNDLESISSAFYMRIFCTKVFWAAFLCIEFGFEQTFIEKMHTKNVDEIDIWRSFSKQARTHKRAFAFWVRSFTSTGKPGGRVCNECVCVRVHVFVCECVCMRVSKCV